MEVAKFVTELEARDINFFTGVPDSQLKDLCNYLMKNYSISDKHIVAVNEGNATAIAAGYHLATGKIPVVYLQNSGIGNIINPVASLLNDQVYGIPCIFIVGWRGEPGVKDEPQHIYQGKVTIKLLRNMNIATMIIDKETKEEDLRAKMGEFEILLGSGKSVAFVICKDALTLTYDEKIIYRNENEMLREEIIRHITAVSNGDIVVSTTGKTSRELFEVREQKGQSHKYDFLTVGSMGHSSSIALGVALSRPNTRVWCIDGDGAVLMHMGAIAIIGAKSPGNYIHVVVNNGAHESVGGQPTVANNINFGQIALACGYRFSYHATDFNELNTVLSKIKDKQGPIFIEIKAAIGSRDNLGRPTITPGENKIAFMNYLKGCD